MEKFAVDLDKVLDDFELNEDRAERFAAKNKSPQPKQALLGKPLGLHNKRDNYPRPEGSERLRRINLVDADFAPDPNPVPTIRLRQAEREDESSHQSSKIHAFSLPPDQSQNSYTSGPWQQQDLNRIGSSSLLTNSDALNSDNSRVQNVPENVENVSDASFSPEECGGQLDSSADQDLTVVSDCSSTSPTKDVVAPEQERRETQWDSCEGRGDGAVSNENSFQAKEEEEGTKAVEDNQSILVSLASREPTEGANSIEGLESDTVESLGDADQLDLCDNSDRPVNLGDRRKGEPESVPLGDSDGIPSEPKGISESNDECAEDNSIVSSSVSNAVSVGVKPVSFQIEEELSDAEFSKYLVELEEEEKRKAGSREGGVDVAVSSSQVEEKVEGEEVARDCLRLESDGHNEELSRDSDGAEGQSTDPKDKSVEDQSEEDKGNEIDSSRDGLPRPSVTSDSLVDCQNSDPIDRDEQRVEGDAVEQAPKDVRKSSVDSREELWVVEGSGKLLESASVGKAIDEEQSEISLVSSKQVGRGVAPARPDSLSIASVVTTSAAISPGDSEDDPIPMPFVIGPPGATPANPKPPSEMTVDESLGVIEDEAKSAIQTVGSLQSSESISSGCVVTEETSGTQLPEPPDSGDSTPSSSSSGPDQEVGGKDNEDSSVDTVSPDDQPTSHSLTQDPEGFQLPPPEAEVPHDDLGCGALALGDVAPFWVPDADAPVCMSCAAKFTLIKRRHHCRACGKVLCSKCCSSKARLAYLDHSEARVCAPCQSILQEAASEGNSPPGAGRHNRGQGEGGVTSEHSPRRRLASGRPDPNNPMEYCSTVPPLEQVGERACAPPPSVMVPVGVLKREGSSSRSKGETKQVMFSDGIRPGGDLTDLDRSPNALSAPSKCSQGLSTIQRKIASRLGKRMPGSIPPGPGPNCGPTTQLPPVGSSRIPGDALPPMIDTSTGSGVGGGEFNFEDGPELDRLKETLLDESEPPVAFALSKNFFVLVKIITLDCCVNRVVWSFTTRGMRCVGQDEVVILLECLPTDKGPPRDIFCHLGALYEQAAKGNTVTELGHSTVQGQFLGSHNHGGFLYIRATFQCLRRLPLPPPPYLFGLLLHRMETPWAKVFPIRVMLRLGAEFRYYPCPLVGIRGRDPVYQQIGHTIMNLLSDFRNFAYILPSVRGMVIHMEERRTSILLPKNRLSQVERALDDSDDHVLALAASFSSAADSHLVCVQGESGDASTGSNHYHTQAINIQNKPRKVTGASFVVFNGALKASAKLTAKSSIVEDGLMVQVLPDTLTTLRTALRNGEDFVIPCGPVSPVTPASAQPSEGKDGSTTPTSQPDEVVVIRWVDDDKNFNIGVKSPIDGLALDGVPSIRVHNGTNYVSDTKFIRWTEVFLIQSIETAPPGRADTMDVSRISESIAHAACLALHPHLDLLWSHSLTLIAVRASLGPDSEGYEAGSGGTRLPPIYMNGLDNELVGVLHRIESRPQEGNLVLELLFHVMEL